MKRKLLDSAFSLSLSLTIISFSLAKIQPLESETFEELNFLPRILFDGLLERLSGAVGVPSSMGEVMELKNNI